jgi:hypothetical protein
MNLAKHLIASTPIQVPEAHEAAACIYTTQNAAGGVLWGVLIWCEEEAGRNEYLRGLWGEQYPEWAQFLEEQSTRPNARPPF